MAPGNAVRRNATGVEPRTRLSPFRLSASDRGADGNERPAVFFSVFVEENFRDIARVGSARWILDAGAYAGYSALYFARQFPDATIVCVEPHPGNFALLARNTQHLAKVKCLQAALLPEEGQIELQAAAGFDARNFWGYRTAPASGGTDAVPARTLETIAGKSGVPARDILKFDIEGGEKDLFDGMDLSRPAMTIIELHDRFREGSSDSFFRAASEVEGEAWVREENVILMPRKADGR